LFPVIVRLTLVLVAPLVGEIAVIDGPLPETAVVAVVAIVGVITGTDVTDTWESFAGYTFSSSARGNVSVLSVVRWPHDPSEFFTITARSY
jgi:xanthosine utilization system XapX-like protein